MDLRGRSLLKEIDFTREEFLYLIELGGQVRAEKRAGHSPRRLAGRNIALIFEKASTRTRAAFEVAAHDEGAHVTYLGPEGSHLGAKETVKDTARVLGRIFDGIEYRGFSQESIEILGEFAGLTYYQKWALAVAQHLMNKGLITQDELAAQMDEVRARMAAEAAS